ncbi:MAG: hypothetical protein GF401_02280 [Chitinivibrionales bacterium]|nr:hypothetical protein [Chitinivibrionales bacterium]
MGTGWARVEAQKHYPTDVLVGAALGNFCATFAAGILFPHLPAPLEGLDMRVAPERIEFSLVFPLAN